jgi:hypothetical protein
MFRKDRRGTGNEKGKIVKNIKGKETKKYTTNGETWVIERPKKAERSAEEEKGKNYKERNSKQKRTEKVEEDMTERLKVGGTKKRKR